jgi:hypothetical protein
MRHREPRTWPAGWRDCACSGARNSVKGLCSIDAFQRNQKATRGRIRAVLGHGSKQGARLDAGMRGAALHVKLRNWRTSATHNAAARQGESQGHTPAPPYQPRAKKAHAGDPIFRNVLAKGCFLLRKATE